MNTIATKFKRCKAVVRRKEKPKKLQEAAGETSGIVVRLGDGA